MEDRIAGWIARAKGVYAQGNWRAAEALCRRILAAQPHHPTALLYGGLCAARGAVVVNFRLSTAYNVAFDAIALQYEAQGPTKGFFAFCAEGLSLLHDLTEEVLGGGDGYLFSDESGSETQKLHTLVALVTRTFLMKFQSLAIPTYTAAPDTFFVEYIRLLCHLYENGCVDGTMREEDAATLRAFAIPENSKAKEWEERFLSLVATPLG